MEKKKILLAEIVGVKGLKGELKIKSFSQDIVSFTDYKLIGKNNKVYEVDSYYLHKNIVIAKLKGINKVEDAKELIGIKLYANRSDFIDLNEDNYYYVDLINIRVLDKSGNNLGFIHNINNFGSVDIIVVHLKDGKEVMLPFTKDMILSIDTKEHNIIINDVLLQEYLD